jgi:hypothetical protein
MIAPVGLLGLGVALGRAVPLDMLGKLAVRQHPG